MTDRLTTRYWNYTFELTDEHPTAEDFAPLKQSYDVLGEKVLERLDEISPPPRKELPRNSKRQFNEEVVPSNLHTESDRGNPPGAAAAAPSSTTGGGPSTASKVPQRDLYALLKEHAATGNDPLLTEFWKDVTTVPDWVDWNQIARGQEVFYRYGGACLTGLAFQSLLGGMGAARVVETLARTGGFSPSVARGRLFETTQHILQCTYSLQSIQPGGDGFASTLRVRLLHATVRRRIMTLERQRPGYYDVAANGVPINDLDSLATIASFSSSLIWLSLPRQGLFLREQEISDYLALWRYIAFVIGCPDQGFRSIAEARRFAQSLLMHEIHPSATGRVLAGNVIAALEGQPPAYSSAPFLAATARWLNGNDLCDALGIPQPGWYAWSLVAGQCLFFCALCYTNRTFPVLDAKKIAAIKNIFWRVVVKADWGLKGEETRFEFKYVPEYETLAAVVEKAGSVERTARDKAQVSAVERRNLQVLIAGVVVVTVFGAVAVGVTRRLLPAVAAALLGR